MGGGPTIDGGMTEAEYSRLQMEERQFMAEQEERQLALMSEMEDKRVQREQAESAKQDRLREKEEEALSALESAVTTEVEGLGKGDKEEDSDLVMDFYGSLAKNTPGMETGGGMTASGNEPMVKKTSGGKAGGRPK